MKVLQINLNHCAVAQDLLKQQVIESGVDVAVISEFYRSMEDHWVQDVEGKSAIWSSVGHELTEVSAGRGFVRAVIAGVAIYSVYVSPNTTLEFLAAVLSDVREDIRGRDRAVVAGDLNAWAVEWGSRATNHRGRIVLDFIAEVDLLLLNEGGTPTFERRGATSCIDITMVTQSLGSSVVKWTVSESYTGSDHNALIWEIRDRVESRSSDGRRDGGWARTGFEEKFFRALFYFWAPALNVNATAEQQVAGLVESMTKSCDGVMRRRQSGRVQTDSDLLVE